MPGESQGLQIVVKRREVKSKVEKERYTHLNAKFQRIARRDKKAFISEQCKEIEENNKTIEWERLKVSSRNRDIKRTADAEMGMIKDRNSKKQQKRLRRGGKNAQKNYTKKP